MTGETKNRFAENLGMSHFFLDISIHIPYFIFRNRQECL